MEVTTRASSSHNAKTLIN